MHYYDKLLKISEIRKALEDDESRILFDARIDYMIKRDVDQYFRIINTLKREWHCQEVDKLFKKIKAKGIIIYGCGHDGRLTKKILDNCQYSPQMFCDSDHIKVGKWIDGIEVISVDTLVEKYSDYLVIIGSKLYGKEIYNKLLSKHYPAENILYPQYGIIVAQTGIQYFDVFTPLEREIFVDGGSYNGDTILDFTKWSNRNYEKIYVFEPLDEMLQCITEKLKKEKIYNVDFFKGALWDKKEELSFIENNSGSYVSINGDTKIQGMSLDEIVEWEKVTFIKLDIEGSELKALKGAKNIIMRDKPRLAICIYHKPEDIIELPLYLLKLVPEYKFYIRHYCSNMWETVLYAYTK